MSETLELRPAALAAPDTGELPLGIDQMVADLGYWKAHLAESERKIAALEEQLRAENRDLYTLHDTAKHLVEVLDLQLRTLTINLYLRDNILKPHDACTASLRNKLDYVIAEALEWARQHAPDMLIVTLDKKAFERRGQGLGAPIKTMKVPVAVISTNLAQWTNPIGMEL